MGTVLLLDAFRPHVAIGYCECRAHNATLTVYKDPTLDEARDRDEFFMAHAGCNIECKPARWPS